MPAKNYQPYYKKIDRSSQRDLVNDFLAGKNLPLSSSREITIKWDRKYYKAKIYHGSTQGYNYYQIRYRSNIELLKRLRKTFIQSYIILKSQKELFDTKKSQEQFRSRLSGGGQQEVTIFTPIDFKTVEISVFIKIKSEWDALFQRLADNNVFGWLFDKKNNHLITRSTNWIKVNDFNKHKNAEYVIYYLVNTKKRMIYIGKAEILRNRVKPGNQHQRMPGDWDLFKYDIIKPEFSSLLERIEDHTIRTFASFIENNQKFQSLGISSYKLMNSNWKKL